MKLNNLKAGDLIVADNFRDFDKISQVTKNHIHEEIYKEVEKKRATNKHGSTAAAFRDLSVKHGKCPNWIQMIYLKKKKEKEVKS